MGEAKRRKAVDPYFGRVPKRGRGLVVSPPLEVDGGLLRVRHTWLDRQELRFALLFWERLVWPASRSTYFRSGPDEEFLEQAGVLSRPMYSADGNVAQAIAHVQIQAFLDLEQREPGAWALAQGENSFLLRERVLEEGRGALVELHRAIPVPDKDVPLNDILEFREKRRDDLLRLRLEIDSFFTAVNNSADKRFELHRHIEQIDTACAGLLRVGKEWKFPFRLSDLKASFELQPFPAIPVGIGGWMLGTEWEMPITGAVLGVAAASFKINMDFGLRRGSKLRTSPYRYVCQFHAEVF